MLSGLLKNFKISEGNSYSNKKLFEEAVKKKSNFVDVVVRVLCFYRVQTKNQKQGSFYWIWVNDKGCRGCNSGSEGDSYYEAPNRSIAEPWLGL